MDMKKVVKLSKKIWNSPHYEDRLEYVQTDFMGMYDITNQEASFLQFLLHACGSPIGFELDGDWSYIWRSAEFSQNGAACLAMTSADWRELKPLLIKNGFTLNEGKMPL